MDICKPPDPFPQDSAQDIGFEGPEKNLQIIFSMSNKFSLLQVRQSEWESILDKIQCSIVSSLSNEYCNSYILSESSLFVFKDRIILKTCGTIPLLRAVDDVIDLGTSRGLTPAAVLYWRKNFAHPELQNELHRSFFSECSFLDARFGNYNPSKQRCGPLYQDHWCFYYVELDKKENFRPVYPTFEIKMHEVHPDISYHFIMDNKDDQSTVRRELRNIIPNCSMDEYFFDPCGCSINGLMPNTEEYQTIHITPENHCSYVSLETSYYSAQHDSIATITRRTVDLFKPVSFLAVEISTQPKLLSNISMNKYVEVAPCSMHLMNGIYITFWSYTLKNLESHPLAEVSISRNNGIIKNAVQSELERFSALTKVPNYFIHKNILSLEIIA